MTPKPVCALCIRLFSVLAHRIPSHLDAMSIVHEPVEDAIGQRGIVRRPTWTRNQQTVQVDREKPHCSDARMTSVNVTLIETYAIARRTDHGERGNHAYGLNRPSACRGHGELAGYPGRQPARMPSFDQARVHRSIP